MTLHHHTSPESNVSVPNVTDSSQEQDAGRVERGDIAALETLATSDPRDLSPFVGGIQSAVYLAALAREVRRVRDRMDGRIERLEGRVLGDDDLALGASSENPTDRLSAIERRLEGGVGSPVVTVPEGENALGWACGRVHPAGYAVTQLLAASADTDMSATVTLEWDDVSALLDLLRSLPAPSTVPGEAVKGNAHEIAVQIIGTQGGAGGRFGTVEVSLDFDEMGLIEDAENHATLVVTPRAAQKDSAPQQGSAQASDAKAARVGNDGPRQSGPAVESVRAPRGDAEERERLAKWLEGTERAAWAASKLIGGDAPTPGEAASVAGIAAMCDHLKRAAALLRSPSPSDEFEPFTSAEIASAAERERYAALVAAKVDEQRAAKRQDDASRSVQAGTLPRGYSGIVRLRIADAERIAALLRSLPKTPDATTVGLSFAAQEAIATEEELQRLRERAERAERRLKVELEKAEFASSEIAQAWQTTSRLETELSSRTLVPEGDAKQIAADFTRFVEFLNGEKPWPPSKNIEVGDNEVGTWFGEVPKGATRSVGRYWWRRDLRGLADRVIAALTEVTAPQPAPLSALALEALEHVEWRGTEFNDDADPFDACPSCGEAPKKNDAFGGRGHADDCKLAGAIRALRSVSAPPSPAARSEEEVDGLLKNLRAAYLAFDGPRFHAAIDKVRSALLSAAPVEHLEPVADPQLRERGLAVLRCWRDAEVRRMKNGPAAMNRDQADFYVDSIENVVRALSGVPQGAEGSERIEGIATDDDLGRMVFLYGRDLGSYNSAWKPATLILHTPKEATGGER